MRLILASASPRRASLLTAAGFDFEAVAPTVDESVRLNEPAANYVQRLASEKSARVFAQIAGPPSDLVVLGADTAVAVDGRILAKPSDDHHAGAMLGHLSGRSHEVMTGLSIRTSDREARRVETTTVVFAPMSTAEVDWYLSTGEGRDKAGGYAIQGFASRFVQGIDGSYSNVVGLPVAAVYELLRELEILPTHLASGR
jgi:septum formation protein